MKTLLIYTDGAARNNPGPAGLGVVFCASSGTVISSFKKFIGKATNNEAEYRAVILALNQAKSLHPEKIQLHLDSRLVAEQVKGNFKIKEARLKRLFWQIRDLIMELGGNIEFIYIPREQNKSADKLANEAIDENEKNNF